MVVLGDHLQSQGLEGRKLFFLNHPRILYGLRCLSNIVLMRNKIENSPEAVDRNKAKTYLNRYQNEQEINQKPESRIFQSPSFMFEVKENNSHAQKKQSYETLNGFRPKLELRAHREFSSCSRRSKAKDKKPVANSKSIIEAKINLEQQKIERMTEVELSRYIYEHKLMIDASAMKKKEDKEYYPQSPEKGEHVSPYAQFSANYFPRKDGKSLITKTKALYPGKNEFLSDISIKFRRGLSQKLQDIQSKLSSFNTKQILQVMTIFSIKEQKQPTQIKKKKESYNSVSQQKQKLQPLQPLRYKKREYSDANELYIDISCDKVYSKKIYSYMSFLHKVNFSNNYPIKNIEFNDKYSNNKIKVYVGNGNNKYLIIALLKRRFWYEFTNKITKDTKFIWTQNSIKDIHQIQKTKKKDVKDKEKKRELKTEVLVQYESTRTEKLNPEENESLQDRKYQSVNPVYNSTNFIGLNQDSEKLIENMIKNNQIRVKHKKSYKKVNNSKLFLNAKKGEKAEYILSSFKITVKNKQDDINLDEIQTITNHIPQNSFIGSKKALFYTMQHYYRNVKKIDPFTILPKTYHFKGTNDQSYNEFLQTQKKAGDKNKHIWIVKPGECTNRGNGIYLMRTSDVTRRLLKKQFHPNGQAKTTIVQSYITDPLLYYHRKFDIRHYMMITIINGNIKAYWYSQGYLRTSSEHFSLQNLNNMYIHLTNDAIQKNSEKYGKYEAGNKLSYTEFQRFLDNNHTKSKINFKEDILSKMKEIATDVVRANFRNLDRERRMNNFEIFGMDFMIDSKFSPWLIEINANPCLEISCPLLSRIIPIMVEHSLRLGLDPLILPICHYPPNKRYYLSDNFIENLRYQIIFDELEEISGEKEEETLKYDFDFDEPEDEYENDGAEIDLGKLLD